MKYAWIDAQRREFALPDMYEVLAVSISGYRAWRRGGTPGSTRLDDPQAATLMKAIHTEVKGAPDQQECSALPGGGSRHELPT